VNSDALQELLEQNTTQVVFAMRMLGRAIADGSVDGRNEGLGTLTDALTKIMGQADYAGREAVAAGHGFTVGGGRASVGGAGGGGPGGGGPTILAPGAGTPGRGQPTMLDQIMARYKAWHAPTLARDASGQIEQRIRQSFDEGRDSTLAVLEDVNHWTVSYADTVYRTNVASAYAAGAWQQSLDPDILEIIPAKLYSAIGDSDTRPNHQAADGLIAGVMDPIWETYSPPMGFRCRCSLLDVDRFELEDRGLLNPDGSVTRVLPRNFAKAHPDPGFGTGRPDRRVYGR